MTVIVGDTSYHGVSAKALRPILAKARFVLAYNPQQIQTTSWADVRARILFLLGWPS